ncbi:hypothetical protein JAAARDRAFT_192988 [Jaapia argillacea MUCL 33604]|uniref:Uncharacterized protein n=1 Tax=Jaapia argillacea MUCL 33604 TaxID=933084 RepID=A0A067Q4J8_9AGAM|nr:hypothetical protein JAAARDRAFT_192988 [Jaapia argillacea MUCL 33604]
MELSPVSSSESNGVPVPLTQVERDHAHAKLLQFARKCWSRKTAAFARNTPASVIWTGDTLETLLSNFHLIRGRENLAHVLLEWRWDDEDGDSLFELVDAVNRRLDRRRAEAQAKRDREVVVAVGDSLATSSSTTVCIRPLESSGETEDQEKRAPLS